MITVETAEDGASVFCLEEGGKTYYLSSRYSPREEARRIVEPHAETHTDIVVLFGAGNPSLIETIQKSLNYAFFVILDTRGEILDLFRTRKIGIEVSNRTRLVQGDDYKKEMISLMEKIKYPLIRFFSNRAQLQLEPEFYREARQTIVDLHERRSINTATLSRFDRLWLRNVTQNTKLIMTSAGIGDLENFFKGLSAVIVAAGPSLTSTLETLKRHRDRWVIVAVDTVCKTLLRHNIIPHIVVVVDPQKVNSRYVENLPTATFEKMIFIAEPAVCHKALVDKTGRIVLFNTIFPYYRLLSAYFGDKGEIDMGGSVVTTAYEAAKSLGFDHITFTGLDLCYTDNAYHVHGSMYEEDWFSAVERFQPFETRVFKLLDYTSLRQARNRHGQPVYIDAKFNMFIKWFERKFESQREGGATFFNSTEGGVPLKNLPFMDLERFADICPAEASLVGKRLAAFRRQVAGYRNPRSHELPRFQKEVEQIVKNIDDAGKVAGKGIRIAKKTMKKNRTHRDIRSEITALAQVDAQLQTPFHGKVFIDMAAQKAIRHIEDQKEVKEEKAIENSLYLYEEIKAAADLNVKYMRSALENLNEEP